jgi:hypothetical protein
MTRRPRVKPHLDDQADREPFALVNQRLDEESSMMGSSAQTGLGDLADDCPSSPSERYCVGSAVPLPPAITDASGLVATYALMIATGLRPLHISRFRLHALQKAKGVERTNGRRRPQRRCRQPLRPPRQRRRRQLRQVGIRSSCTQRGGARAELFLSGTFPGAATERRGVSPGFVSVSRRRA